MTQFVTVSGQGETSISLYLQNISDVSSENKNSYLHRYDRNEDNYIVRNMLQI